MEFLLWSLGVLVYTIVGAIVYGIGSALFENIVECRDWLENRNLLREKDRMIEKLETDVDLWKIACDKLDKEVKELKGGTYCTPVNYEVTCEAKKKSNLS